MDIFWQRFDELAKEDSGSGDDEMVVDHVKLKERLVSSGKFYVGEAQYAIEQMVKSGKIIEVEFHRYKKLN